MSLGARPTVAGLLATLLLPACGVAGQGYDAASDAGARDATSRDTVDATAPAFGDAGGPRCENLECQRATCPPGASTKIRGVVRDPAGKHPLFNALVYVPNRPVAPFPNDSVQCTRCDAPASGSPVTATLTDASGAFLLDDVPAGDAIPLVVQMGRWRRQLVVPRVEPCVETLVEADALRLPRDQREGDIPRIAVATGQADPMECLLRKIGVDDSEITLPSGGGRVHVYKANGGVDVAGAAAPPAQELWASAAALGRYDVVLFPCEGAEYVETKPPESQQALIDYTTSGGRAFLTHYAYAWLRGAPSPFSDIGRWSLGSPISDTPIGAVDVSFPKGAAFAQWLMAVGASNVFGSIPLTGARNDLAGVAPGAQGFLGVAASSSVQLMAFPTPIGSAPEKQCGRVVYSNFHVAESERTLHDVPAGCVPGAMTPQELALEFMLFDLSSCIQPEREPPRVPPR